MTEMNKKPSNHDNIGGQNNNRNDGSKTPSTVSSASHSEDSNKGVSDRDNSQLAMQSKELASQVSRKAQALVESQVEKQAGKGADELNHVAQALRETTKHLENNLVTPYVEKAAHQIERVSDFLRTAKPKGILRSVGSFAKREPLIFLGGAFAVGIAMSRFMKSSSHHNESRSSENPSNGKNKTSRGNRYPQGSSQHHSSGVV